MEVKVYILNAFTKSESGGNPAGVVINHNNLNEYHMLAIAKKLGFSETAFVHKKKESTFNVKFFTPETEIDLCGHATIAVFSLMRELEMIKPGKYYQETKAGSLQVKINHNGSIFSVLVGVIDPSPMTGPVRYDFICFLLLSGRFEPRNFICCIRFAQSWTCGTIQAYRRSVCSALLSYRDMHPASSA